uniref:Protocadherin 2 alpha a 1 n=1 Tax=Erpetoichthys calabaricus TaxID=27687 RepID=A0A8C4XAK1_ERPCA
SYFSFLLCAFGKTRWHVSAILFQKSRRQGRLLGTLLRIWDSTLKVFKAAGFVSFLDRNNSLKFYQLSKNDHFILEVEERSRKSKIPVLVLHKGLDRELKSKYDFVLSAVDGGNPPRSGNMNITVMVSDINDNAPVFAEQMYSVTVEENAPVGTLVVKMNASDPDEGSNGYIVYSFGNSVHNKISELFQLDIYTGEITVNGVIDFEEKDFYEFDVKASDRGNSPISSFCTVLIQIKDMNDNPPQIDITSLSSSVFEDVKPGSVVGVISITDLDAGLNSKISCTISEKLPFVIKPSIQENLYSLTTNSRLDRESASQYNITITAKDFGHPSLSSYKTVLVNVLDVNDNNPQFLENPYVFFVEENNKPGASIFTVSAVDEDTNENALITYYLWENEAAEKQTVPFLSINSNNGQVTTFTSFDFEQMKSFTFSVVAKDSGVPSLSGNVTVNVFILDQNDNPPLVLFPLQTNGTAVAEETIPRNVKAGYLVTRIRAYDADVGYNAFVNSNTGQVTTFTSFDFEQMKSFTFSIVAKDSGVPSLSSNVTVNVFILDQNDNPPLVLFPFPTNWTAVAEETIPRNVKTGYLVTRIRAYDADVGYNALLSFSLEEATDSSLFRVGRYTGEIRTLRAIAEELKSKYDFVLSAVDGGNPPRSGNMNITVMVADFNDNAPVFVEQMYSVILEENAPLGTVVVKVNASDLDEGSNGYIVYSFGDSVQNKISELFRLDIYTGEITVNGVIDFEEKEMYEFDVKASDNGNVPMSSFCTVLVQIKDVNDNAPHIEITSLSSSVFEDVKPGSVVGVISITDLDSGFNSKIACTISEKLPFEIKPSIQENLYSLTTHSRLDREFASQFNITVIAKDFGHPSLSSYKTVLVNVLDVNDNNPKFLQNPYVFFVEENNTPGASIFTVSAVDEDTHENALITYYLWENEAAEKQVVPFLSINSNNGQVTTFTSFDFEQMKSFTFSVVAKDSGVPSLSSNVTVNVFILDQNDNPPLVLFPFSTNGTAVAEETIPRNVKTGYLVTRIRAYDADVGYNALLSFSLEEATDSSLFRVGRYTGEIRTLRAIAESDVTVHKMVVLVKDSGSISLSASVTVIVTTAENTEAHALSEIKSTTTREEPGNKTTFYLIIVLGSVSSLFLITIIALIAFQCHKTYHGFMSNKYLDDTNYAEVSGSLFHSHHYQTAEKRLVLIGPEMNREGMVDVGSNSNTLLISDNGIKVAQMVSDLCV